jgi:hypothetical protein
MGTLEILQIVSKTTETANDRGASMNSLLVEPSSRVASHKRQRVIWPQQFAKVQISIPSGLRVHGLLRSVSRGGVQILTRAAAPIRCPLMITITGCRPLNGEAFYCLKRSAVYQLGIVFPGRQKPNIALGAVATIRQLEEPFDQGRGNILDVGGSSITILCKTWVAAGARIRVESGGWVLFGVVKNVIANSMISRCVEIHLEAAFPARPEDSHATESFPLDPCTKPRVLVGPHHETSLEGVSI